MRIPLLVIGVLLSLPAVAAIYRTVDANGNVVFTDMPSGPDAKPVELQQPSTYAPRTLPTQRSAADAEAAEQGEPTASSYTRVEIVSPQMDETIRDNTGLVTVSVALQPRLRPGDSLTLLMNGEVLVKDLKTTNLPISNVDRGSHELQALVVDDTGSEVGRSEPVTFHLHRAALGGARPSPR